MSLSDDHPDGPDPIRDMVWGDAITGMALEAELAFERPHTRFGETTTDPELDAVVRRDSTPEP